MRSFKMFALVVFYAGLQMLATGEVTPRYFIIAPNVIRVDVDETVLVDVVGTPEGVQIPVTLYLDLAGSNERISETTVRVTKGASEKVTLRIGREQLPEQAYSQKFINLVVSANTAHFQFQDRRPILLSYRAGFVFIQTDKPVYTPSQRVYIRVVGLDQDMFPANNELRVDIANPDQTIVRRYIQEPVGGFLTLYYYFQPNPVFGNWTVTAYYDHQFKANTSVQFEVKECVLPEFRVEVDTHEKYILPETPNLVSFVTARYIFGEPVVGNVFVRYGVYGDDGTWITLQEKKDLLNEGLSVTDLDMDQVTIEDWTETLMGKTLVIQAFVTDRAMGETINASNTMVTFSRTPYKFNWDLTQRYFKRGLSFAVKATVQYMSGLPAAGIDVAVSATARLQTGAQVRLEGSQVDGNQEPTNKVSGAQGEVDFRFDVPADADSVSIRLETRDPALVAGNTLSTFIVQPQQSDSGEYLAVRIPSGDFRQTQQIGRPSSIEVQLTHPYNVHEGLNYFVIAGGKIVHQGIKRLVISNTALGFVITHDMAPSSRVVAYYIRPDGKVVADALYFQVEEVCENQIDLAFRGLENVRGTFMTDGSDQNVELRVSARAHTTIRLLAVDEAVFALRNYHRLTQKKVLERKAGYDLGCGPGGGQSTATIFQDVGVTVLTNAVLNVASREAPGCPSGAGRVRRSLSDDVREEISSRCKGRNREHCEKGRRQLVDPDEDIMSATRAKHLTRRKRVSQDSPEMATSWAESLSKGRSSAGQLGFVNFDNILVRSNFPESWMFTDKETDENGQALQQATLPDSVTTWVIEAVGVSEDYDMCVANPLKLQVRKPFFLDLSMPDSVQRYEQIEIIASVFNYADADLQVTVYLKGAEGVCSEAQPGSYSEGMTVDVAPKQPASVRFVIVPMEVKKLPIEVAAVANSGGEYRDAIRKLLTVRPEGYERKDIVSIILDPENSRGASMSAKHRGSGQAFSHTQFWEPEGKNVQFDIIHYDVNSDAIPGTSKVRISVVGEAIGNVIDTVIGGLDQLLRIPSGNGEQTMGRLAPNVYIYKYLKHTDQFTAQLETSSQTYIRGGIERELTFRRLDGSFGILGENSRYPGSTWLTSFVNKVTCQAKEFAYVDDSITCKAMEWLVTQTQREDGSFQEVSWVYLREITGGVQGDVSMTAFVLISLLECDCNTIIKDSSVAAATLFLEDHLEILARPYAIAITAYALALANSNMAENAITMLKEIALYDEASDWRRWGSDDSSFGTGPKPYWYSRRPEAIEVETTSYALLALLEMNEISYTHAIVNWLTNQENYNGGFVSTQDTVVTLQALSGYAIRAPYPIDMNCRVVCQECDFTEEFVLQSENALVRRQHSTSVPDWWPEFQVFVNTQGSGMGQLKFEYSFYIPEQDSDKCDFELNFGAQEEDEGNAPADGDERMYLYDINLRYLGVEATGMAILDVGLFTGYRPIIEDLKRVKEGSNGRIQRYEVTDRSVVFYFGEIPVAESTRLTFRAERQFVVGKAQPVSVRVYDYYNPTVECVKFISPGDGSGLLNTLCEGGTCQCVEGDCASDPTSRLSHFNVYDMKRKACASTSHFAYEVRVDSAKRKASFQYFNMTILAPLKYGLDMVSTGETRTFWKSKNCGTPDIRSNRNYLVIGSGGLQATDAMGHPYFKYIIDERMSFYVWPTKAMTARNRWRRIERNLLELKMDFIEGHGCTT